MTKAGNSQITRIIILLITIFSLSLPAYAKYSGGTGDPNDPYQIATAEDLILLGDSPEDYDKHFLLTADIDLDPNLPGRKVFDKAVIASGGHALRYRSFIGIPFTGVFDGNSHTVSHLTIIGEWNLGLFGYLNSGAEVKNLGVVDANINGLGSFVGSLAGNNFGNITACYSTGTASGNRYVGGLVGKNSNIISHCYSTVAVSGDSSVGGLVGENYGTVTQCYSTGTASGRVFVGGLVGLNSPPGGTHSVWDTQTSGLGVSGGGVGLTTSEMTNPYILGLNGFANDPNWVLDAGRDYPHLAWEKAPGDIIPEPDIDWLEGGGTAEDPYRIDTSDQLILLSRASILWDKHFVLGEDIDLDPNLPGRQVFRQAIIPTFSGTLDGRNQKISHLTIIGAEYLGLFGQLDSSAEVSNLILEAVDVNGTGSYVGSLSGYNQGNIITSYSSGSIVGDSKLGGLVGCNSGNITSSYSNVLVTGVRTVGGLTGDNYGIVIDCYSIGTVSGTGSEVGGLGGLVGSNLGSIIQCYSTGGITGKGELVGGLVASNSGSVNQCYSTSSVSGNWYVGGLVASNSGSVNQCYSTSSVSGNRYVGGLVASNSGSVNQCYRTSSVSGDWCVGGLVASNSGSVNQCYSTSSVSGKTYVGGLVGYNGFYSSIVASYSSGLVSGTGDHVGGLVGYSSTSKRPYVSGRVDSSFWDTQTSGQPASAGGTGKTTVEMQTANTFLEAGWDFVDEIENGTEDIWWILEGQDYPRLWWEAR